MPFCGNCGQPVQSRFCPDCGTPAAVDPPVVETVVVDEPAEAALAAVRSTTVDIATPRPAPFNPYARAAPVPLAQKAAKVAGAAASLRAAEKVAGGPEERLWMGRPSPIILIPALARQLLLVLLITRFVSAGLGLLWFAVMAIAIGVRYPRLTRTIFEVTSMRVRITTGLLSVGTITYPLLQVRQPTALRPFPRSLFQMGSASFEVAETTGRIEFYAIRDPEAVLECIDSSRSLGGHLFDSQRKAAGHL
jgi:hypothetical protein